MNVNKVNILVQYQIICIDFKILCDKYISLLCNSRIYNGFSVKEQGRIKCFKNLIIMQY